ncbi:hypothetical protein [Pseudomonas arsenicoxydans]|uniref:Uncharacterized protein n=1 Tax=Pseudomonas arsenicoxydans TaxID=702115 RepID=A0A502I1K0_9PSED|nr:hypothetical protein [Pseudomonas arsenicoxydans]TPG79903.1 hypothetical protein EAH78_08880 [Pseudomonas arsenicoxydans]
MTEFTVSDGTIEKMTCERERVFIEFLDWQEERWIIIFENVLGVKSVGAIGVEVSEMFAKDVTSLSQELFLIDASEVGLNYCFTCARECNIVLTVIASGYTVEKCD